jgi:purine-binding chemotaxis protein CheW
MEDLRIQLVTFKLGNETYGIDIMDVKEIVSLSEIRPIPGAPSYVSGIMNLRGVIIPIIDLHKRFQLEKPKLSEDEELLSGYIIINIDGTKIGIVIDKVSRVLNIESEEIQAPPQMMSGIGSEYIRGVIHKEEEYLIFLDIRRIFNSQELQQLHKISK